MSIDRSLFGYKATPSSGSIPQGETLEMGAAELHENLLAILIEDVLGNPDPSIPIETAISVRGFSKDKRQAFAKSICLDKNVIKFFLKTCNLENAKYFVDIPSTAGGFYRGLVYCVNFKEWAVVAFVSEGKYSYKFIPASADEEFFKQLKIKHSRQKFLKQLDQYGISFDESALIGSETSVEDLELILAFIEIFGSEKVLGAAIANYLLKKTDSREKKNLEGGASISAEFFKLAKRLGSNQV